MAHSTSNHVGLRLGLVAIAIVLLWRVSAIITGPHRLMTIANELGSVPSFRQGIFADSKGLHLICTRQTERGLGLYFVNPTTGEARLLDEERERGFSEQRFGMLGWSPDDSLFAYGYPPRVTRRPEEEIVICDGKNGAALARIAADPGLAQATWLSSRSIAYLANGNLSVIEINADGSLTRTRHYQDATTKEVGSFVAVTPTAVAWQYKGESSEIWKFDYTTVSLVEIWESATNALQGFTYSQSADLYQLICKDAAGFYTIYFRPKSGPRSGVNYVTREDDRSRYAIVKRESGKTTFQVQTEKGPQPVTFPWQGVVQDFAGRVGTHLGSGELLVGDYLYFAGDTINTPNSLWQYNLGEGSLRSLLPGPKAPAKYAGMIVNPVDGSFTNGTGVELNYHVWQPSKNTPGKKHPLILAQGTYIWAPYYHLAAQEGYYFALAEREFWDDPTIYSWSDDILKLYEIMAKNPDVDTNRVYLYASSWETEFCSDLLDRKGGLFKGIIMTDPGQFPQPESSPGSVLILVGGEDDNGAVLRRARQFQDEMYKRGIPAGVGILDGAQHIPKSVKTERERSVQIARFLHDEQLANR